VVHVALWLFDSLPFHLILFGIGAHLVYLQNLGSLWPFISLTSVSFITSCVLVVADHFLWFYHFTHRMHEARRHQTSYQRPYTPRVSPGPTFTEVASFFGVCIWLVPLFLFLSLSANDNALPTMSGSASRPGTPSPDQLHHNMKSVRQKPSRTSLFTAAFDTILPSRFRRRGRQQNDGIIAPPTPRVSSEFQLAPPPMRRVSSADDSRMSRLSPRPVSSGLGGADDTHIPRSVSPSRHMTS
jgi:hypothetical protein